MIPPLYTKLAIDFCCSGRIRFGFIKGKDPNAKGALEQLGITKFPSLLIGKEHHLGNSKEQTDKYSGGLKLQQLKEWAAQYDTSTHIGNLVPELHAENVMQNECVKQAGTWCFVAILPDDPDTITEGIEVMRQVAGRRFPPHIRSKFVWLHAGKQEDFAEQWRSEINPDEPAVVAIRITHGTPAFYVMNQAQFNPRDIRREVFNVLLNLATLKHLGDKVTMLKRTRKSNLDRLEEEAIEREEALLKESEADL